MADAKEMEGLPAAGACWLPCWQLILPVQADTFHVEHLGGGKGSAVYRKAGAVVAVREAMLLVSEDGKRFWVVRRDVGDCIQIGDAPLGLPMNYEAPVHLGW